MAIESAYVGEDVPLRATFDGGGTDPDDTDATPDGVPDASITISRRSDGTAVVNDVKMSHLAVGTFEYVWDTTGANTGGYDVEVTAEFSAETKIVRDRILLEN